MNTFEVTFKMNNETVTIDTMKYTLDWHGFRQYINIQSLYRDLIEILLNGKIDGEDFVEYSNSSNYWCIYLYNGKKYRVWFYCDGQLYIQHIDDEYNSIDDMLGGYTDSIFTILEAIINDRS